MGYAVKGAIHLIKTEASIKVQFSFALLFTAMGFYFSITPTEWMAQVIVICLVMSIEGLNTAVEKVADFIHPDFHEKIGIIKDIAAGAVFFASLSALVVGLLIYVPKFLSMF